MFLEDSTVRNGVLASTLHSGEDYPFRKRCAQHCLEMDISPKADVSGIGWGPASQVWPVNGEVTYFHPARHVI